MLFADTDASLSIHPTEPVTECRTPVAYLDLNFEIWPTIITKSLITSEPSGKTNFFCRWTMESLAHRGKLNLSPQLLRQPSRISRWLSFRRNINGEVYDFLTMTC